MLRPFRSAKCSSETKVPFSVLSSVLFTLFSENKALMSYETLQIETHPINNSSVAKSIVGFLFDCLFFPIVKVFRHSRNSKQFLDKCDL